MSFRHLGFTAIVAFLWTAVWLVTPLGARSSLRPAQVDARSVLTETARLMDLDGLALDEFGRSLAISGDTAVVGAEYADEERGRAYVFERDAGGAEQWGLVAVLQAGREGTFFNQVFGSAVAIDGDIVLVGAAKETVPDEERLGVFSPYQGAVYVFERNAGGPNQWGEVQRLTAPDPNGLHLQKFGLNPAISGDTALIAAPEDHADGKYEQGYVYVFDRDPASQQWQRTARFTASDGGEFDNFGAEGPQDRYGGTVLALSGDTALVGLPETGPTPGGQAYVFERNAGGANQWAEVARLTASEVTAGSLFGLSVAIDGNVALVGSPASDAAGFNAGAVYLFERNAGGPGRWGEVRLLTASHAASTDWFGASVALAGDTAVVAAPVVDLGANTNQGRVYLLQRDQGGLGVRGEVRQFAVAAGQSDQELGARLALDGGTILASAVFKDDRFPQDPADETAREARRDSVFVFEIPQPELRGAVYTGVEQTADGLFPDTTGLQSLWVFRDGGWLAFFPRFPGAAGLTDILLGDLVFVFLAAPLPWEIS